MKITLLLALVGLAIAAACAWFERHNKQRRSSLLQRFASAFMWGLYETLCLPVAAWRRIKHRRLRWCYGANIAEGVHESSLTRLTDAAITTRNLLYKKGSDADHIAVSGAADVPLGTVDDEASAAEEYVGVQLLGKGASKIMVASELIGAGVLVYGAANGKIATTGTQCVGVSLTAAAADGDELEVLDIVPAPSPGIAAATFDANTILAANADNTPLALTIAEQRIVGRITGGNIAALTGAQIKTITDPITWTATTSAADALAIPITHRTVNKTTGADAEALTLADGAFLGQRLNINLVVDGGGDGTLTPTTPSGFATIVFADAGDFVDLEWTTAGWRIVGIGGLTAQPTVTV